MRRRLATLAAAAMFALALSASPASASPAVHDSGDAKGLVVRCGDNTYRITGTYSVVMHLTSDFTGHETITLSNGEATDQVGNPYKVVGAETHGATYNARTDAYRGLDTFKYRIVGTGDTVNIVTHSYGSFAAGIDWYDVNSGTCDKPHF